MAHDGWFDERKPAAVLKHGILARYAYYFSGRAGRATGNQVAFVDGYAGEGRYNDGNPGSPLLLVDEAQKATLIDRQVQLEFIEADGERATKLESVLEQAGLPNPSVWRGVFGDVLTAVQAAIGRKATLYFVDPFSLGLPFESLVQLLSESPNRHPVDVIYHFSSASVARIASRIVKADIDDSLSDMPERLSLALGPDIDWRASFESIADQPSGTAYPLAVELLRAFSATAAAASGVRSTVVEVKPRPSSATIYTLALFSRDAQAHWDYCDVAGASYVDWLHRCDHDDYEANLAAETAHGIARLFQPDEPDRDDLDERLEQEAVEYLRRHLEDLVRAGEVRRFVEDPPVVYGSYLGRARERHARAAVKAMHRDGIIDDDGTGDFYKREITLKL